MVEVAAITFSSLVVIVVIFQCALALGAPWGEYAMGGTQPGKYPPKLRLAALLQGALLALAALVVLVAAELVLPSWGGVAEVVVWFVVLLMAVSCVLNLITKSKWERRLWVPVTIMLFITSLIVALG